MGWHRQFAIRNVSVSKTKFYHPVVVLPQEVASQILDLIQTPLARYLYEVLIECLIMLHTLNDYQCFEALVSLPLSGDQKPLHLMNRMLALLPDDYKPDFDASLSTSILIFSGRRFWILTF